MPIKDVEVRFQVLIPGEETGREKELCSALNLDGCACRIVPVESLADGQPGEPAPDLILVSMEQLDKNLDAIQAIKQSRNLPVVAIISKNLLVSVNGNLSADDFIVEPYDVRELLLRIKRLLRKNSADNTDIIKCGDLYINPATCEVSVAGRPVMLTFKEFELLKFLAINQGRVFSRQKLLDRVWGYDYYGGDRTVDVHVRRLRSKIEDQAHTFIETVRNMGYRLKAHRN